MSSKIGNVQVTIEPNNCDLLPLLFPPLNGTVILFGYVSKKFLKFFLISEIFILSLYPLLIAT